LNDKNYNPLMHNHWSQTLETLIDWLAIDDTLTDAVVVRRLVEVLAHAPHPDLVQGVRKLDTGTVERLLAAGAADALALRLIGAQSGFFASRGAGGEYLVSVVLPGQAAEMTAAGPTLVRAIVCALALTLSQSDDGAGHAPDPAYAGLHSPPVAGATLH
jgi:hypothetical protein